jgi:hypothetical protein
MKGSFPANYDKSRLSGHDNKADVGVINVMAANGKLVFECLTVQVDHIMIF